MGNHRHALVLTIMHHIVTSQSYVLSLEQILWTVRASYVTPWPRGSSWSSSWRRSSSVWGSAWRRGSRRPVWVSGRSSRRRPVLVVGGWGIIIWWWSWWLPITIRGFSGGAVRISGFWLTIRSLRSVPWGQTVTIGWRVTASEVSHLSVVNFGVTGTIRLWCLRACRMWYQ